MSKQENEDKFELRILKQIDNFTRRKPLLTREEEQVLIAAYQDPRNVLYEAGMEEFGWAPAKTWLSPTEKAVCKAILNPGPHFNPVAKEAFDTLVARNLGLVKKFCGKRVKRGSISEYDLFVEGVLGLMHAIDKYDRTKRNKDNLPLKFSTYCTTWASQYGQRLWQQIGSTIRIPIHVHDQISKIGKAYAHLASEHFDAPPPDSAKLAEATGIKKEVVELLGRYKHETYITSLDNWSNEEETTSVGDSIEADGALQPEVLVEEAANKDYLHELINKLAPEDAKFMSLYHGLLDQRVRTPKEMASAMNLKRDEVIKWEKRCMDQLKALACRERVNL